MFCMDYRQGGLTDPVTGLVSRIHNLCCAKLLRGTDNFIKWPSISLPWLLHGVLYWSDVHHSLESVTVGTSLMLQWWNATIVLRNNVWVVSNTAGRDT